MSEEHDIHKLPQGKQRRMAMLSLGGVQFTLMPDRTWRATWWDGHLERLRQGRDLHDLVGYTYKVAHKDEAP